jgi:diguanylate cyclase (GGDEF)-like protein
MSLKVLLIEDDQSTVAMIQIMLESSGSDVEIIWTPTFEKAWEKLHRGFDVILMSFSHAEVQNLERIRQLSFLPVVALASTEDESLGKLASRHGAQDFLVKNRLSATRLRQALSYAIERHHLLERIKSEAMRDSLTGLYNRRTFTALAEQQFKAADRANRPVTFLYLDMDRLKDINDRKGHRTGDQAIQAAANCMIQTFRQSDSIGRVGGDEFAILAPDMDEKAAKQAVKRLDEALTEAGWNDITLSVSTGIAVYLPGSGASVEEVLDIADQRMYTQKRQNSTT